jgi:cytochrome c oxidase subunit II
MSGFLAVSLIILLFIIIFQIAKASEYVSVLKGEKKTQDQNNRVNAFLMITFLIAGLIGVYICNDLLKGKLLPESASVQGVAIDNMMKATLIITGIVFLGTQILLFVFAFKYRASDKRKAFFYPHNNKLELLWTVVPAIVMTILVAVGLKHWFELTSPAPSNAMVVEVTGKQFQWIFRYPGKDGVLGRRNYKLINDVKDNPLGQDWSDKNNYDDIVSGELHLVVNKPVKLEIGSRDVVHSVGLPYFRLKMDAIPGIPTNLWFTPRFTTKQMAKMTGDPDFVYKLVCDQLCGAGHFSMTANVIVETQAEYDQWIASQKSQYQLALADHDIPGVSDSTTTTTTSLPVKSLNSKKIASLK